jgi:hypothetical protein
MEIFGPVIDFVRKKFSDFEIVPKLKGMEVSPLPMRRPITEFEDLDKDDDLNIKVRDILIKEVLKIMSIQENSIRELEFYNQAIRCDIREGIIALSSIRQVDNRHEMPVWFDGKTPYPLEVWLKEQILTNIDVVELEKGIIKMI